MFYDEYFPFYTVYGNPTAFTRERLQEREFALMKSFYPKTARKIQDIVETECEILDYEGSRLYDEYPDKCSLRALAGSMFKIFENEEEDPPSEELIQILLLNEIYKRRHGGRRGKYDIFF